MDRKTALIAYLFTGVVFSILGLVRLSAGETPGLRDAGLAISGVVLTLLSAVRLRRL